MVNAAKSVFNDVQCKGCFFHLSQAAYRKWRELKLEPLYNQEHTDEGRAARMTFRFDYEMRYK
jgi:hypothetical protein